MRLRGGKLVIKSGRGRLGLFLRVRASGVQHYAAAKPIVKIGNQYACGRVSVIYLVLRREDLGIRLCGVTRAQSLFLSTYQSFTQNQASKVHMYACGK